MKVTFKSVVLGLFNAAVLPLLIAVMTALYIQTDLFALSDIQQLVVCRTLPAVSIVAVFAICFGMLSHVRWPFTVSVYILGGLLSLSLYRSISSVPFADASELGFYALAGAAMVSGFRQRFKFILAPKISVPGPVLLLLVIAANTLLSLKLGDRLLSNASFDWRISLIAFLAGLVIAVAASLVFTLIKSIVRNESVCGALNRIVYREHLQSALPEREVSAPSASPAAEEKSPRAKAKAYAVSDSTDKLLSQSDLPQIKVRGKKMKKSPASAGESKPPSGPDTSDTSWLDKHLSSME